MTKSKSKNRKIIAFILFVAIFIGLLIFLFYGENFNILKEIFNTSATKEQIQQSIGKLGIRAYIVVFILSMLQVILTFVPAEPLHVIAGLSFGLCKGMAVCFAGIMVGNTIIYILYKIFGAKLTDYFASNVDFDFDVAKKSKKIALIVIILYCLPAIPYGIICFFAATLGMKYPKYILITGIGSIPSLILDVGLGHITMATSWAVSISVFIVIIVLLLLMIKFKKQIFQKINEYVKKSQERAHNKVGEYNGFVFKGIGTAVLLGVKRKVKVKIKNNVGKLDKPCIVLVNHGSFYDFVYAGKLLMKEKPHFVVARLYFHHKKLSWILRKTGAFPKSLMTTDIENCKNCLKVINNSGVLAMMPEARLSTIGKFEGIQNSTYNFLQKMNVAIYTIKINGAYLAKPKWGDKIRKGAMVEARLDCLYKKGESKQVSTEEFRKSIDNALMYNEYNWLENNPQITYKHKTIAEGLENILCICPHCKEKYSLTTSLNTIVCNKCNKKITIDNRYKLSGTNFDTIEKWYDWQKNIIKKEIENNKDFCLESEVDLHHLSTDGKRFTKLVGHGICRLDKNGLIYKGSENGIEIKKEFKQEEIYRLLFGAGEDFEIYEGKEIWYFVPKEKRSCVMWYIVSELIKN